MPLSIRENPIVFIEFKKRNQVEWVEEMLRDNVVNAADWQDDELEIVDFKGVITQIGSDAFRDCTSLSLIIFHESLHRIDFNAFAGCTALHKIIFPDSLEEVECWLDGGGVTKTTLYRPSSDELIKYLQQGYAMNLRYNGEEADDHWA